VNCADYTAHVSDTGELGKKYGVLVFGKKKKKYSI
jgi:hypothetical protein